MGQAFASFFAFIIAFFRAGESLGNTANNLASWAEESSAVFKEEASHKRGIVQITNNHERKLLLNKLAAEGVDITPIQRSIIQAP